MAFSEIIKIIALGAIAGFGGGFLWGVADRRGTEAAVDFADHHIRLPKNEDQAELVFSCGSSEPLVVYDLLTDEVLNKKWLIEKRLSSSLTRALDSDLFSHATASAAEGFGVMYSFKDELKAWKAHRAAWGHTLGVIGAVVIPTGLLGYLASDWVKLECGSKALYERLSKKEFWRPYRVAAAKSLFDHISYCIDRHATLLGERATAYNLRNMKDPLESVPEQKKADIKSSADIKNSIAQWREYIAAANQGLPEQTLVESRYKQEQEYIRPGEQSQTAEAPTWGDSFYQRLYGTFGFTAADADFDKIDFRLLLSAESKCINKLDPDKAKRLYLSAEPDLRSIQGTNDANFFESRRRMIKALSQEL